MEFELLYSPLEGLENLSASPRRLPFLRLSLSIRHVTTQPLALSSEILSPKASVRCHGDFLRNLRRRGGGDQGRGGERVRVEWVRWGGAPEVPLCLARPPAPPDINLATKSLLPGRPQANPLLNVSKQSCTL